MRKESSEFEGIESAESTIDSNAESNIESTLDSATQNPKTFRYNSRNPTQKTKEHYAKKD